jgi:hypothetical protein
LTATNAAPTLRERAPFRTFAGVVRAELLHPIFLGEIE